MGLAYVKIGIYVQFHVIVFELQFVCRLMRQFLHDLHPEDKVDLDATRSSTQLIK